MKKLVLSALLLSGCAAPTVPLWFQPNKPHVSSLSHDLDCQVEAVQKVPASNQVRSTPTYTTPTYLNCNPQTNSCISNGGQVIGGQTYTVDVNSGLRWQVLRQCMAKKGWQLVSLPPCGVPQHKAFMEDPEKYRAPKGVTAESCAILDRPRKEWVIYTPS
ncbi:hypothetical protein [Leisingera sp. M523]|uniref:hypothetical protein n=1 Tax=Leisingera sp. M523 TaxID=2867013 RepID=UPI0021A58029|nr:hypothetical protein [Leisingera sp. M523]UWQ30273.1 hypothetical protein K3557_06970 [Leisingera sp. M523]